MTAQIQQQEAAVDMLRMLVKAKRAKSDKLDAAINELNRLKADHAIAIQKPAKKTEATQEQARPASGSGRKSPMVKSIMADAAKDPIELRQSALSEQATRIRAKQAELSNMLNSLPTDQPCPELVGQILNLHNQVEGIWTQKRFLERNVNDGPAQPEHDQQVVTRSIEAVQTKAALTVQLQKFREKQSKLIAKMKNPRASLALKSKWEIELAQVQAGIEECIQKRTLI